MHEEFIHIGFSKSASTFLQSLFKSCDEIEYLYKSGRFSNDSSYQGSSTSNKLKPLLESDEHIILPKWHPTLHRVRTTQLIDLPNVFQKINEVANNPRIILVLRNQYDLFISRYSQHVVGSGGSMSIHEFFNELCGSETSSSYFENEYSKIIELCYTHFGQHNVLVLLYEDIKLDRGNVINELNTFIGVDLKAKNPTFKSRRKGVSKRGLRVISALNHFLVPKDQPDISQVKTYIPKILYNFIIRVVRVLDGFFPGSKIKLDRIMKDRLIDLFSEDNRALKKYFSTDLKSKGYV